MIAVPKISHNLLKAVKAAHKTKSAFLKKLFMSVTSAGVLAGALAGGGATQAEDSQVDVSSFFSESTNSTLTATDPAQKILSQLYSQAEDNPMMMYLGSGGVMALGVMKGVSNVKPDFFSRNLSALLGEKQGKVSLRPSKTAPLQEGSETLTPSESSVKAFFKNAARTGDTYIGNPAISFSKFGVSWVGYFGQKSLELYALYQTVRSGVQEGKGLLEGLKNQGSSVLKGA